MIDTCACCGTTITDDHAGVHVAGVSWCRACAGDGKTRPGCLPSRGLLDPSCPRAIAEAAALEAPPPAPAAGSGAPSGATCACGCGEPLPGERGHRRRYVAASHRPPPVYARRARRSAPRARTIAPRRLTVDEIRTRAALDAAGAPDVERPRTRGECLDRERPCPFVACKHHLFLDVNPETGSIKLNFPDLEVWELKETCALDVADRGGITLEEVGEILNLTRERIRQVEVLGLLRLKRLGPDL